MERIRVIGDRATGKFMCCESGIPRCVSERQPGVRALAIRPLDAHPLDEAALGHRIDRSDESLEAPIAAQSPQNRSRGLRHRTQCECNLRILQRAIDSTDTD